MPWVLNHWGLGAPNSPNNAASTLFCTVYIYSKKNLGSKMGAPNLFLAPGVI